MNMFWTTAYTLSFPGSEVIFEQLKIKKKNLQLIWIQLQMNWNDSFKGANLKEQSPQLVPGGW